MKPGGGRYQAATQVKGLSPEISIVIEADLLHIQGRQNCISRYGKRSVALSGSETGAWCQMESTGTWEIQGTLWRRSKCRQPEEGEEVLKVLWKSDQLIVEE